LDHLRRRSPARPLGLAGDVVLPLPLEAFAADTDAVLHGAALLVDVVEPPLLGVDDDRVRTVWAGIGDVFALDRGLARLDEIEALAIHMVLDHALLGLVPKHLGCGCRSLD